MGAVLRVALVCALVSARIVQVAARGPGCIASQAPGWDCACEEDSPRYSECVARHQNRLLTVKPTTVAAASPRNYYDQAAGSDGVLSLDEFLVFFKIATNIDSPEGYNELTPQEKQCVMRKYVGGAMGFSPDSATPYTISYAQFTQHLSIESEGPRKFEVTLKNREGARSKWLQVKLPRGYQAIPECMPMTHANVQKGLCPRKLADKISRNGCPILSNDCEQCVGRTQHESGQTA
jgi:hypothetical protein